jgi:hypothetical protein
VPHWFIVTNFQPEMDETRYALVPKTLAGPLCKPHNLEFSFAKLSDKKKEDAIFIRLVVTPDSQQKVLSYHVRFLNDAPLDVDSSSPLAILNKPAWHLHALVRLQDLLLLFCSVHELKVRLLNEGDGWHGRRKAELLGHFLVREYRQGAERVWQSTQREHVSNCGSGRR